MIEIYNEVQEESSTRKLIHSDDTTFVYFECNEDENLELEISLYANKLKEQLLIDLSNKKDSELEYQTVELNSSKTRVRAKDQIIMSSVALVGGTYEFENGSVELTPEEGKEFLVLMLAKSTGIVQRKIALEAEIASMDLFELSRCNINCVW